MCPSGWTRRRPSYTRPDLQSLTKLLMISWTRRHPLLGLRIVTGLLPLVVVGACSALATGGTPSSSVAGSTAAPSGGGAQASTPAGPALFEIVRADGTSGAISMSQLKGLPATTIMSFGEPQNGPTLTSVLLLAGVSTFTTVTLSGSNGSKTLTRAEVTGDVVLAFNNRGTVKLVSPAMSKAQRILDVAKIVVT